MQWEDEGIVLSSRRHGETAAILSALTAQHGRHSGLVHGGAGARKRPILQPGNRLQLCWRGRLDEHLGSFTIETLKLNAARVLDDELRLAALASACAMSEAGLAERDPHPRLFDYLSSFLERLPDDPEWLADYVRFEVLLLAEIGFSLDLSRCAVTGSTTDLCYVSPRTGRAVSLEGAGDWAERLLPLPAFLQGGGAATRADASKGLRLTAHFLERHLFDPIDRSLPVARERLTGLLSRSIDD